MASEDNEKKKEDTKTDNDKFKFTLDQAIPDDLKYPSIGSVKNDAENLVRNSGVGLVNSKGNHESISLKKGYVTVTPNSNSTTGYVVTINIGDGTYVIEDKELSNATATSNAEVPTYDVNTNKPVCEFYSES